MTTSLVLTVLAATTIVAQSINHLGSTGGTGPSGGIGEIDRPVLAPKCYITDGNIPEYHPGQILRELADSPPPVLNTPNILSCNQKRTVLVDNSENGKRQEMLGFGHSWTDSTVSTFSTLEDDVLDEVMDALFGSDGNNMGFMRHTIGSSDMSGTQYSFDDNGPSFNEGAPDPDLGNFGLGTEGTAMAKMIAMMGEYKSDVFLFGSPWSYPGWMKQNGLFIGPNLQNGQNILNNTFDPQYTSQAVDYFTKYIDAYKELGVQVNGITLSNEPLNYQGGYPCMYLGPDDAADILNAGLADSMKQRNVTIISYDHNTDQPVYPSRVIQRVPQDTVGATGWHCYAGNVNYTVLQEHSLAFPEIPQLLTECSSYLPSNYSIWIAQHFLSSVQMGAAGGTFWVMGTDPDYGPHAPWGGCAGCLGSIIVNSSTEYTKTHDYYMMGQFSRFVRRGARNYHVQKGIEYSGVSTTDAPQFLINSIQNPDSSWAIMFLNNYGTDQDVELSFTSHPNYNWYGTIPQLAVVTWLLPSWDNLAKNSTLGVNGTIGLNATVAGINVKASMNVKVDIQAQARYPSGNSTTTAMNGTGSGLLCPMATTSAAPSSSASTTTPLLPVPNTGAMKATTLEEGQFFATLRRVVRLLQAHR